jgi:hypothetical protein
MVAFGSFEERPCHVSKTVWHRSHKPPWVAVRHEKCQDARNSLQVPSCRVRRILWKRKVHFTIATDFVSILAVGGV